ncbi:hypothetical protein Lal_00049392 [Lupinus albus]|nr:hypothetical protein Lal_00049392 [Lupinus albus]
MPTNQMIMDDLVSLRGYITTRMDDFDTQSQQIHYELHRLSSRLSNMDVDEDSSEPNECRWSFQCRNSNNTKFNAALSPEYSLKLYTNGQLHSPPSPPTLGFRISDSRSSENRLAWARTHDSSHHSGTDALAQAKFSRPGEIHPASTPFLSLKRVPFRSGENPRKFLRATLSPSLGRADSRSSENRQ